MAFKSTKDKLVEILTELTGTGQPIAEVSGWSNPSPENFPFCYVKIADGGSEERKDSSKNFLHMPYKIVILFRSKNTEANENKRLTLTDSVLAKLREKENVDTLEGTIERFDILDITPLDIQDFNQPVLGVEIITRSSLLETITS